MKELFLSCTGGYWYAFDKESVRGVATVPLQHDSLIKREKGKVYLELPNGEKAEICNLSLLYTETTSSFSGQHAATAPRNYFYAILHHADRVLAIPMRGRGKLCMADLATLQPLPPVFPDASRQILQGLLINGQEVFMRLDLDALMQVMDKIAILRKKKQSLLKRRAQEKEATHAE